MWTQVSADNLPDELAEATSSLWQYDDLARVGVMRGNTFLVPPYLWAEVYHSNFKELRKAPLHLTELQKMLNLPFVHAEAMLHQRQNIAFIKFLGFVQVSEKDGRALFYRSIF